MSMASRMFMTFLCLRCCVRQNDSGGRCCLTHHPAAPQIPSRRSCWPRAHVAGAQNDRGAFRGWSCQLGPPCCARRPAQPQIPSLRCDVPRQSVLAARNDRGALRGCSWSHLRYCVFGGNRTILRLKSPPSIRIVSLGAVGCSLNSRLLLDSQTSPQSSLYEAMKST